MMRTAIFLIIIITQKSLFAQWSSLNSGTSSLLHNVFFPTLDTGYALKADGGILKTVDGGNNWLLISNANTAADFYFLSADTGFAVKEDTILMTSDGGANWTVKYSDSIMYNPQIFFADKNTGYVINTNNYLNTCYIYKTLDSGNNWVLQSTFSGGFLLLSDIYFTSADTGYISFNYGEIYKTVNGGQSWLFAFKDSTGNSQLNSIHFPSHDIGFVAGLKMGVGAVLYKTIDAGVNWTLINTQQSGPLYSVFFTNNNTGYAVGGDGLNSGTVITTIDGGNNWTLATQQTATFYSVFFPDSTVGYAVGTNGTIIKYTDTTTVYMETNGLIVYKEISILPNPSKNGNFRILELAAGSNIIVIDMLGQMLYQQIAESNNPVIDISAYPRGIYFLKMQNRDEISVFKLIFQ